MKIKLNKEQILRNLNKIIHESRINEVSLTDYKEGKPKLNFMLMDLNNLSQKYNNIKNKITTYQLGDILDGTVDLIDDRDFIENIEAAKNLGIKTLHLTDFNLAETISSCFPQ